MGRAAGGPPAVRREGKEVGGEAAGSADVEGAAVEGEGHDGVVEGADDGAVVEEEGVGDGGEAGEGFFVVGADGLAGGVGGGGDEGDGEVAQEEVVEGGVGEEGAEGG